MPKKKENPLSGAQRQALCRERKKNNLGVDNYKIVRREEGRKYYESRHVGNMDTKKHDKVRERINKGRARLKGLEIGKTTRCQRRVPNISKKKIKPPSMFLNII